MRLFRALGQSSLDNDIDARLATWRRRAEKCPDDIHAVLRPARLLMELGQPKEAQRFWTAAARLDPQNFETAYQRARFAMGDGATLEAAVATTCSGPASRYASLVAKLLANPPDLDAGSDRRSIAIVGVSYCGSTLLDRILGGLDGVRSIGESHWLVKRRLARGHTMPIDVVEPTADGLAHCATCRDRCPVLTFYFRVELAAERRQWYARLAKRLDTMVLVSADKNLKKLLDNDPLLRFEGVVLFKSPLQAWQSHAAYTKPENGRRLEELDAYLDLWARSYGEFLDDFRPRGGCHYLYFEAFARSPARHLKQLCERLRLPFEPGALTSYSPGHAIGGNGKVMRRLRETNRLAVVPVLAPPLAAPELKAAAAHASQRVFRRLLEAHYESFPVEA
jgi:hypothetical protein